MCERALEERLALAQAVEALGPSVVQEALRVALKEADSAALTEAKLAQAEQGFQQVETEDQALPAFHWFAVCLLVMMGVARLI